MFSGIKNIVNSSLQELERLGELSAQQLQLQREREDKERHGQPQSPEPLPYGGVAAARWTQSESVIQRPSLSPSSSPSHLYNRALSPPTSTALPSGAYAPANPDLPTIESEASNGVGTRGESSNEGFTSFGLSGIKRSLSGLPRAGLDLSSLRTSLDMSGRPAFHTHSWSLDLTPSRDGRELGEWPLSAPAQPLSINTNTAIRPGRPKRRFSTRSASLSGLSGPFTPNTMMKMDPFFFASLQGLPDELKQAAFTPLPVEDDDELLEQLDAEFSPSTSHNAFALPFASRTGANTSSFPSAASLSRSLPTSSSYRPMSAPANGPIHLFQSPPSVRSPLADDARPTSLSQVLDAHDEEDIDNTLAEVAEEPATDIFGFTQPRNLTNVQAPQPSVMTPVPELADQVVASNDLPEVEMQDDRLEATADENTLSLSGITTLLSILPTETAANTATADEPTSSPAVPTQPSPVPTVQEVKPAPPSISGGLSAPVPKHEPLAHRLARLSRSSPKLPEEGPKPSISPSTGSSTAASKSTSGTNTPKSSEDITSAYKRLQSEKISVDKLLHQYTSLASIEDLGAFEAFLKAQASPAKELEQGKRQLESERSKIIQLESDLREARSATSRAESRAKDEEEKKAKSISLLK